MQKIKFRNCIDAGLDVDTDKFSTDDIINEPMLFSSSMEFARKNGGKITNTLLDKLDNLFFWDEYEIYHSEKGYVPVIDTKVVMLMKDQYPCIPGWHCDGVPREDKHSQPNMNLLNEDIYHLLCTVSDNEKGVSNTKFVKTPFSMKLNDNEKVWGQVNKKVEEYIKDGSIETMETKDNMLYLFRRDSIHSGQPAKRNGWRFFFRLSFYHTPPKNEIRKQVQVYANPNKGW